MRIRMTSDGVIKVGADSPVEEYAIMQWLKEYAQSGNLRLDVDTNIVVESLDGVKEIPDLTKMGCVDKHKYIVDLIEHKHGKNCTQCKFTNIGGDTPTPCSECMDIDIRTGFEDKDE